MPRLGLRISSGSIWKLDVFVGPGGPTKFSGISKFSGVWKTRKSTITLNGGLLGMRDPIQM